MKRPAGTRRFTRFTHLALLAMGIGALAWTALGTERARAVDPAARELHAPVTGDPDAGAKVFSSAGCVGCHALAAANAKGTVGPNLDNLKPSFEQVVAAVTNGRAGIMPPFAKQLSEQQIGDVAAFVVVSTGGTLPAAPPPAPAEPPPPPPAPPPESGPVPGVPQSTGAPAASELGVSAREWKLAVAARRVAGRAVKVRFKNSGRQWHWLSLMRTDLPAAKLGYGRGRVHERGRVLIVQLWPGGAPNVTIDLEPGRYVLVCRLRGHYRRGMRASFRVTAPPPAPPVTDPAPAPSPAPPPPPPAPAPAPAPPAADPPVLDGPGIFKNICGSCHTMAAAGTTGSVGPDLDDEHPDIDDVLEALREGPDEMPSFVGVLSDEQMAMVAAYVARATGRDDD